MWALKILHEKNWRVNLLVQEFHHPPNFPEFLQPLQDVGTQRGAPFYLGFLFICFLDFGWLGSKQRVSPFYNLFNIWTWHKHWMGIYLTQIFPFSSLTIAWYSCRWWSRRAWGRCKTITLLWWKCHCGWRMRTGGSSPCCTEFESRL